MDHCLTQARVYEDLLRGRGVANVTTISPGVDLDRFTPQLNIGVVGRAYHTGRKGEHLVGQLVDMPEVAWHFTGDRLARAGARTARRRHAAVLPGHGLYPGALPLRGGTHVRGRGAGLRHRGDLLAGGLGPGSPPYRVRDRQRRRPPARAARPLRQEEPAARQRARPHLGGLGQGPRRAVPGAGRRTPRCRPQGRPSRAGAGAAASGSAGPAC